MNVVRFSNWGDTFSITGLLATKGAWRLCRCFVIDMPKPVSATGMHLWVLHEQKRHCAHARPGADAAKAARRGDDRVCDTRPNGREGRAYRAASGRQQAPCLRTSIRYVCSSLSWRHVSRM